MTTKYAKRQPPIKVTCDYCKREFLKPAGEHRQSKSKRFYCNFSCTRKGRKGISMFYVLKKGD